jgi:hypothetical protein
VPSKQRNGHVPEAAPSVVEGQQHEFVSTGRAVRHSAVEFVDPERAIAVRRQEFEIERELFRGHVMIREYRDLAAGHGAAE